MDGGEDRNLAEEEFDYGLQDDAKNGDEGEDGEDAE